MKNDSANTNGATTPNPFASFRTVCPECGVDGKLAVVEVVLAATGKVLKMNSPLHADGFEVPTNVKDASTDEEIVRCGACGKRFPLSEVTE
jgi:hypothetical protein